MINPFKEINWRPDRAELRKFARSLIIGFPCIAVVFYLVSAVKAHAMPEVTGFAVLGIGGLDVGLLCLFVPIVARPLYYVWYGLSACIGIVMANLLFCLMFYGLFAPVGALMRLFGRDPLRLKWQRNATSHWQDAEPPRPARQYFSQY